MTLSDLLFIEDKPDENKCRYYKYCESYNPTAPKCNEYDGEGKSCYKPNEVGY